MKVWTLRQRLFRSAAKTDRMCIDFFTHSDQSGLKKGQSLERISRWRAAFSSQSLDFFKSLAFKIGGEAMDRQFFRHLVLHFRAVNTTTDKNLLLRARWYLALRG